MTIKAVIFDLDGTIAAFNLDYKGLRAEVRVHLIKAGVAASILSGNESVFDMLKKTELFLSNAGKPAETTKEIRRKVLSIAEKYELEAAEKTSLMPGAVETLKDLRKMGLRVALCTINSEKSTERILSRFKLTEYFDTTVSREKVSQVKPSPEHCTAALKTLDVTAEETVVVGDSINDILVAREVDAIAVGLPTGVSTQEKLRNHGANFIITSITDLPVLIKRLNRNPKNMN